MNNQALFSLKDRSKKLKCRLLQFLFGTLWVNNKTLMYPIQDSSPVSAKKLKHKTFNILVMTEQNRTLLHIKLSPHAGGVRACTYM